MVHCTRTLGSRPQLRPARSYKAHLSSVSKGHPQSLSAPTPAPLRFELRPRRVLRPCTPPPVSPPSSGGECEHSRDAQATIQKSNTYELTKPLSTSWTLRDSSGDLSRQIQGFGSLRAWLPVALGRSRAPALRRGRGNL